MDNKKFFRLDMSIAVEAITADDAFEVLTSEETMKQIKQLIIDSKDKITEMFLDEENTPTIIN